MNETANPLRRARLQFSLQSLIAITVFVALGLGAWKAAHLAGVVCLVSFVGIVAANLAIACYGARFRYGVVAGALGGAVLWSVVGIAMAMREPGVLLLEESAMPPMLGVLVGCVCGAYARRTCRQVTESQRRGLFVCGFLLLTVFAVFAAGRCLETWKVFH